MNWKKLLFVGLLGASLSLFNSCSTHYSSGASAPNSAESSDAARLRSEATLRSGLGTGFGEEVESSISYTKFTRNGSKPSSVNVIYYNDKLGVDAMTHGSKVIGGAMQKSSDGLVEWGVKSQWSYAKNIHSEGKRFVIGKAGSKYSLVVKNIFHSRVEVVLSVDGIDVMDGKSASVKKRGYIINPGQTLEVKGFRTSEQAVASFEYSSVAESYSHLRHGDTRNVGVIGMAVYPEKIKLSWLMRNAETQRREQASAFAEAP
ncbi:hypothetical protein ACFPK9_06930 [Rubritalea spongiae]|uniref:Lipoprotein n=1 Tax=Rubritalea spongiae TaxID=430797 RepID=A0ABW5E215_9BACT